MTFTGSTPVGKKNGKLDILINNAGVQKPGHFESLEDRDAMQVVHTNLLGRSKPAGKRSR